MDFLLDGNEFLLEFFVSCKKGKQSWNFRTLSHASILSFCLSVVIGPKRSFVPDYRATCWPYAGNIQVRKESILLPCS